MECKGFSITSRMARKSYEVYNQIARIRMSVLASGSFHSRQYSQVVTWMEK